MLRKSLRSAFVAVTLLTLFGPAVKAGPFEDGIAAYKARQFGIAVELWRPIAEAGDFVAQYYMGFVYGQGQGVEQDVVKSVRWYEMAGKQGYTPALHHLGLIFATGEGVEENDTVAVRWFRMAAELGHASSQLSMGVHFDNGEGVPENKVEAYAWVTISATQGHLQAERLKLFMESDLPPQTLEQGLELARKYWDLYVAPFQN